MKIQVVVSVFDDLFYCESESEKTVCQYLGVIDKKNFCFLHRAYLEIRSKNVMKCSECVKLYKIGEEFKNIKGKI